MYFKRIRNRLKKQLKLFKFYGFASVTDDFLNGFRVWSLNSNQKSLTFYEGSISGLDKDYLTIVGLAKADDRIFQKFKSNRQYREILEHVDRETGQKYLDVINKYGNLTPELITFCKQDHCKPFRYSYSGIGRVSPSNLRYAKICMDIQMLFGNLNGMRIAEIGVGYGGQAHIIHLVSKPASYKLIDLPEVVNLTLKYIDSVGLKLNTEDESDSFSDFYDLVISNYAFSEISREIQEHYLKEIILKSKRGYVIYNDIQRDQVDSIKIQEFVNRVPGSIILKEIPLTHSRNSLVIWGYQSIDGLVQS